MRGLKKYHGLFPAFYACYDESGEVSISRTKALAKYLRDAGVKGLYVGGSSGECIYLSPEEREIILEAVMEAVGKDLVIIAHVACNNTRDSVRLAKHAKNIKVDAIAAIPPIYFKLPDHAIEKYWTDIMDAAKNTDFLLYNIPQMAGVALSKDLYKKMTRFDQVIGLKNSSPSVMDIERFKSISRGRVVFNGPDEHYIAGRLMGATGGIGGTYIPMIELFIQLEAFYQDLRLDLAQQLQAEITNVIELLYSGQGNLYALLKEVLLRRTGLETGTVRLPLLPMQDEDELIVDKAVSRINRLIDQYVTAYTMPFDL